MIRRNGAQSIKRALAVAGALALLSGCGGSDDKGSDDAGDFASGSVDDIVAAAKADMGKLESVRLKGEFTSDDGDPVTLDLGVSTSGDCTGTLGVMGGVAEIVSVDGASWFKPDEAFWRASAGDQADLIIGIVGDKWVVLPPDDSSFTSFCDLDQLLEDVTESDDEKEFTNDGEEAFDGTNTVKIIRTDADGGDITAFIATEGEHYILHMEKEGGDDPGEATFSAFNEEIEVEAPAEDDTIDLDSLG